MVTVGIESELQDAGRAGVLGLHVRVVWALSGPARRAARPPPSEKVVAAGDIASCSGTADEATAGLVGGIEGATVLALGDEAYPAGTGARATTRSRTRKPTRRPATTTPTAN